MQEAGFSGLPASGKKETMPESGDSGRDFSGSAFVVGRKLCRAWERRTIWKSVLFLK